MDRAAALQNLYDRWEEPTRESLSTPARFVRGAGRADADIVFVGEAPGLDEDRQGRPFVGRAGQILSNWLALIGLERADVFITNVVKCHPMKNPKTPDARGNDRPPTPAEIRTCWPILEEELQIIQPKLVVTLGSPSTQTVLQTKEKITALRGRTWPFPGSRTLAVFPMFHPAALCHNPTLRPQVEKDLQSLKAMLAAEPNAV